MSVGFVHSVRVPRLYKVTAKTVQTVEEEGASLKQKIYEQSHPNLAGTYSLAIATIQHGPQLDQLLRKTQLLFKEPRLDPWLARVLIAELLWGKKKLASETKPINTILSYEKVLREELEKLEPTDVDDAVNDKKVQKPRYVRVNTLVKSVKDSISSFTDDGWTLLPKCRNYSAYLKALGSLGEGMFLQDFHIPELFAFPPGTRFYNHPGYKCGAIVLQDKASCFPAYLLGATPGSTVLDMCSAPGMKTTHLAAIMKNKGKIIAVERDNRRYQTLCEILKTNGAHCVTTVNGDAMRIDPNQYPGIEYILVDPSCSGSGMLDRLSLGRTNSKSAPGRLINLQSFQVFLLRHALLNFPTVKRVVYSTCSMYPEENEMVVDEILENIGDAYDLVPIKKLIGSDWKNFSSTDYKCNDRCLYARPDVDLSNGFFVAVFERNFDVPLPEYERKVNIENRVEKAKKRRKSKSNDESVSESKIAKMSEESTADEAQKWKITKTEEETVVGKKRKSKSVISECESVTDGTLDGVQQPKKQKKKKRNEEKSESTDIDEHADVQNATNGDEAPVEKRKKKRKETKPESMVIDEYTEAHGTINGGEVPVEGKKKKKKRSAVETLEEISSTVEISNGEKSKGKKRKQLAIETTVELNTTIEISDDESSKKKKKNKKQQQLSMEKLNPTVEISNDESSKKKKKKKKPAVEMSEEVSTTVEISADESSKKKKKK